MLSLQLKSGEYFTIGGNIVVQVFHDSSTFRVLIKAPREVPILRGNLLERGGEKRPNNILEKRPQNQYEKMRNQKRMEAWEEKAAQREEEKKRAQEREAAVEATMQELLTLLDQVEAPAAQKRLAAMRARLHRLTRPNTPQKDAANL